MNRCVSHFLFVVIYILHYYYYYYSMRLSHIEPMSTFYFVIYILHYYYYYYYSMRLSHLEPMNTFYLLSIFYINVLLLLLFYSTATYRAYEYFERFVLAYS